jgi:hypothetical protein
VIAVSDRSRWTDFEAHPVDFELGCSTEVEFSDLLRDFSVEVDVKTSTDAEVAGEQRCGPLDDPAVVDKIKARKESVIGKLPLGCATLQGLDLSRSLILSVSALRNAAGVA